MGQNIVDLSNLEDNDLINELKNRGYNTELLMSVHDVDARLASIRSKENVEACDLIISSTKQGDVYRQRVLDECGEEPDKEEPHKWVKWYDGMVKIYKEMFN